MNALALTLAVAFSAYAPQQAGTPPLDPVREARVQQLGSQLRCPVCQGMSIAASGSSSARAQMDKVRELVESGKSDEEIRNYFVARYGEWALLEPPAHGFNWIVWLGPGFVVLLGAVVVLSALSKRRGTPEAQVPAGKALSADALRPDDKYLAAIRAELDR